MKKWLSIVLALALMCSMFVGCGAKEEAAPAPAPEKTETKVETTPEATPEEAPEEAPAEAPEMEPIVFKYATSHPDNAATTIRANEAFARITERTNGALQFETYAGGQLGTLDDNVEQLNSGMPILVLVGFDMLGDIVTEAGCVYFPYIFEDIMEIFPLQESEWFKDIEAQIIESGVKPLGYGAAGYRYFIGQKPVRSPEDIKNTKVRMAPSAMSQGWITVMGGSPSTNTWTDNYSLLQTGVFELCEADIELLWTSSLHEVTDYLSLTAHYTSPCSIICNNDIFESLPEEYQEIFEEEMYTAMYEQTMDSVNNMEMYIQNFRDAGITVVEDVDKESFKPYLDDLFIHLGLDPSLYDTIRNAIAENS